MHDLVLLLDEGVLLLHKLYLLLSKFILQFILLLDDAFECLNTPAVEFEPEHLLEAWVFVKEHVIKGLLSLALPVLLIHVVLHISLVRISLKCVPLDTSVEPVEYDFLIHRFAAHGVLHTPDDLEAVVVELARLRDGRVTEPVLEVVLQQEGIRHVLERK